MSAFVVTTETMQRVVDAIDKRSGRAYWEDIRLGDSAALDAVGASLFRLNAAAVRARYPFEPCAVPAFRYRPLGAVSEADHFRALDCLLYQCSEGSVPETDEYQALARVRDRLAHEIASKAARAAGVPWDWPERAA